ncbi:hypothetical protein ACSBR2_035214 [Camellia fascicularis]
MLQETFEKLFEALQPCPSCIIGDKYIAWVADTARKLHIPRINFDGVNCFTLLCSHHLHISKVHESVSESEPFELPGLPDRIELTRSQLPTIFQNLDSSELRHFRERLQAADAEAFGVVINSFKELEPRYVERYRKVKGDKVWCIGPLSLCNKNNLDKAQRGNKAVIDENQCLKWLDEEVPGSVVYACLGSLSRLTAPQLIKLGLGLEASKHPFVWVIIDASRASEIEKWVEDGFEERTKGRGLVIRGWAPQVLIVAPGCGSLFDTLRLEFNFGRSVCWSTNDNLASVLETGVSVGAQGGGNIFGEDKCGELVKREAVREAVERAMGEGIEGEERRRRARVLEEMAKKAMEEEGSSYLNIKLLIHDSHETS